MKLFCVVIWSWLSVTAYADCGDTTDVTQTVFLLCTPETGDATHAIPHDASNLGTFDSTRRTFVLMHGFQESGAYWPVSDGFNAAFNSAGSFNLIYVDWECLASAGTAYLTAAKNALGGDSIMRCHTCHHSGGDVKFTIRKVSLYPWIEYK